jgi:hypothetical protein
VGRALETKPKQAYTEASVGVAQENSSLCARRFDLNLKAFLIDRFKKTTAHLSIDFEDRALYRVAFIFEKGLFRSLGFPLFNHERHERHEQSFETDFRVFRAFRGSFLNWAWGSSAVGRDCSCIAFCGLSAR